MKIERVLVVDDDILLTDLITEILQQKEITVVTAKNGESALEILKEQPVDLILTDMKMPSAQLKKILYKLQAIIVSGQK